MKKLLLLGLVASVGLAASAGHTKSSGAAPAKSFAVPAKSSVSAPVKSGQLLKSVAKFNGVSAVETAKSVNATTSFGKKSTRPAKVRVKADGDIDTCYIVPDGSFYWGGDRATGSGYYGNLVPAWTEVTWANVSTGVSATDEFSWWVYDYNDGEPAYFFAADTKDYTDMFSHSPFVNYFEQDGGLKYYPALTSKAPLLVINDAEDGFQIRGLMQYGGAPQIVTDITTGDVDQYPVCQVSPFRDDLSGANWSGYYNGIFTPGPTAKPTTMSETWTRMFANDPSVESVEVLAVGQRVAYPGSPYILKSYDWDINYRGSQECELTLSVYRIVDGEFDPEPIAVSQGTLEASPAKNTLKSVVFNFETEDELGGLLDGIVIDSEVVLVLTGYENIPNTDLFSCVSYTLPEETAENENRFFCTPLLKFNLVDGSSVEQLIDGTVTFTNGASTIAFFGDMEVELPWLVAEKDSVDMNVAGDEQEVLYSAYKSGDEWDVWTVEGEELPEWLSFETEDAMDCDGHAYNYYTTVKLTAEALPEGVDYRECQIKLGFRDAWTHVLTVTQGEKQEGLKGDVNGDGEVDVKDSAILINVVLGLDDAAKYAGRCDVDGNGEVDAADINALINIILGTAK